MRELGMSTRIVVLAILVGLMYLWYSWVWTWSTHTTMFFTYVAVGTSFAARKRQR